MKFPDSFVWAKGNVVQCLDDPYGAISQDIKDVDAKLQARVLEIW